MTLLWLPDSYDKLPISQVHYFNMSKPSGLRSFTLPSDLPTQINRSISSPPPVKKQKMSLTQTYMLAHQARGKLSKEASKHDHNLHRLVGHANMLDNLMIDLQNAEQEQEQWFNETVSNANESSPEPRHVQWVDSIPEEVIDEEAESDSDSDDEEYGTAEQMPVRKVTNTPTVISTKEVEDEDEAMEDDDDYEDDLALTRTSSHSPPELMLEDSDSESEDEPMPPSPTSTTSIPFNALSDKQRQAIATTSFYQSSKSIRRPEDYPFDHDMQTAIAAY